MTASSIQIFLHREKITEFCQRWYIGEFSLFGSVLRSDFRPDSDVDVLVTFAQGKTPSAFDLVAMQEELEEIFGRKVDLVEKKTIEQSPNWLRRKEILETAQIILGASTNQNETDAVATNKKRDDKPIISHFMSQDRSTLLDIARVARTILAISLEMRRSDLDSDIVKQSAILYQIAILGEAVKRLSQDFRAQHPQIPWKQIAGMRDVLTHKYDRVNLDIVWNVVQNYIPGLLKAIEPLLPTEED